MSEVILHCVRLTKYKGQAASCAPRVVMGRAAALGSSVSGGALALALMVAAPLLLTVTGAQATDCVVGAPGVFVCSGASVHVETLVSAPGGDLVVTTDPGFSIDTTGTGDSAIDLSNVPGDFNITFTDANASIIIGDFFGIFADNDGQGSTSITTSGEVTGVLFDGIQVINDLASTDLDITVDTGVSSVVTGLGFGIFATNLGSGTTQIEINGAVISDNRDGVQVRDTIAAEAMTITVGASGSVASDDSDGIDADAFGDGDMTVTINGSVDGGTEGIDLVKNFGTGNLIVLTGVDSSVAGGDDGIETDNEAAGSETFITVNGTVVGGDDGIEADNDADAGAITIITGAGSSVMGDEDGINADNDGIGALAITVNGVVAGGTGFGINTVGVNAVGPTMITLNAGSAVSATSGQAIFNDAGDSATIVNAGASVVGDIVLGDGSDSLVFAGGDFSGVTLFDGGDDSDVADTFIDTLTFAASSGALTGANVLNWENVVIGAGSTISFVDNMLAAGLLAIDGGGILDATWGVLALAANVANNGTITMLDGAIGDSVIVNGNFSGLGSLFVDVDLAGDIADTLVINGDITGGATLVTINDISVGPATGNDVLVVNVGGTTNPGDFFLAAPVMSGAFLYDLALTGGNDWFLQQGFNPATPVYEAYPQILLELNSLPTLRQRTGDQYAAYSGMGVVETDGGQPSAIWTRIEGDRSVVAPAASTTELNYVMQQYRVQAGIDTELMTGPDGKLMAGINASYGMGVAEIFSATGNGVIATDVASLGATATWFGNEGFYLDAQGQVSWYTSDLSDLTSGLLVGGNQGMGYAFSLEAGQSVDLGGGTSVTPQAQLVYSSVGFDGFVGPGGTVVSLDNANSLVARLGITLDQSQSWTSNEGITSSLQFYGLANLYYELAGPTQVDVSGTKFINQPGQWTGEIGVGGSLDLNDDRAIVFGEATFATSLESFGASNQYGGVAGVRVSF